MSARWPILLHRAGRLLLTLVVLLAGSWGALALAYRAPGGTLGKSVLVAAWVLLMLALVVLIWRGRPLLALLGWLLLHGVLLLWWNQLAASNGRLWSADVAQPLHGDIDGDRVVLHNVRNFHWHSETDADARWETRAYNLQQLDAVDMILSYWDGTAIAHMIVSFGFVDGSHVAFSVEIRREQGEAFSEIGGFFKQFELSVIAADERDVIGVRTQVRGEDDYLYRVRLSAADRRALFLAYVGEANALAREPRFYNTITANCTTLVFHMMQRIVGHLPLDYRLLLTGYLAEYVHQLGALDSRHSLAELQAMGRITERAKAAGNAADFSARIRQGIAPLDAPLSAAADQ